MTSPVNSNTTNVFLDEEFEDFRKTMKEEVQATLEKTSENAKIAMKEQVDGSAKLTTPYITSHCKVVATSTSPQPIASTVNICITSFIEPVIESSLKKVGHKSVDQCVDTMAKKVIDQAVNKSVDSTKSYFNVVCEFVQSKFS